MEQNSQFSVDLGETPSPESTPRAILTHSSTLGSLLIKYSGGLIATEQQARLAAIIFVALMIILSFFVLSSSDASLKNERQRALELMEESINATNAARAYEK